jgi:NAD(P)-dependent dehydrogenase (short-subunit alcohol dehydrogenase family)
MIDDFQGKTAVLTGAGSGFGLECARLGAKRGMNLVLVDVQADALANAEREMRGAGVQVLAMQVDVSNAVQMEQLARNVAERFGAPHFVFNNAGVACGGLVWENTLSDWEWVLGVNLWGVVHGVRLFAPMMLEAAKKDPAWRGHIVNTASMAGVVNMPNMGVYNVSKHAVVSLSETLYHDLKLVTGQVGASVVCPHFVPTGIAHSGRNRPEALAPGERTRSQQIGAALGEKAVASGKVTAAEVAAMIFDAVAQDRFYVFSHPQYMDIVGERASCMMKLANPPDAFAQRPEQGEQLRAALRAA